MDESSMFTAPIPGMSLTTEPGARPWENPPKHVKVEDVIDYYIPRLADDDRADQLMLLLEQGAAVNFLVDTMITTGAMKGIHTMESGMLAAPVLAEVVKSMAEIEGVEYVESYSELRNKKPKEALVARAMEQLEEEEDMPLGTVDKAPEGEVAEEMVEEPMPKKRGIAIIATAPVMQDEEVA